MVTKVKKTRKQKVFICPTCNSEHTVRHGFNTNIGGKRQRRKCQECGHTFYEDEAEVR